MKRLGPYFLSLGLLCIAVLTSAQSTYQYNESTANFFNPERGMYRYFEARTADGYLSLDSLELEGLKATDQLSLIYRIFYLDGFYNDPISPEILALIEDDFRLLRDVGFKAIVRFAYTDTLDYDVNDFPLPPFDDTPDPDLVFQHITQLGPILAANSDVILTLHNGFYGIWGENYYSDDFGSLYQAPISPEQQQLRDSITDTLLNVLPLDRTVSVRYPYLKTGFLGLTMPDDSLTSATAFQGTPISRIAYHNDCFLADFNDYTFADTLTEKPYWEAESRYVLMGGETCRDTAEFTQCTNALSEMERFHWTYLNDGYHPDVLQRWVTEGCMDEIRRNLGYRLVLREATLPDLIQQNQTFSLSLDIENVGWAAPMLPRGAELVLRDTVSQAEFTIVLTGIDLRRCGGGQLCTYDLNLITDNTIPPGDYDLFLFLPDGRSTLREDPNFAIRLANEGLWETETGFNDLQHTATIITVTECKVDTTISVGPITSGIYRASNDLTVEAAVATGANVRFEAGNSIRFLPGFSYTATAGSEMVAVIQDCTPEPEMLQSKPEAAEKFETAMVERSVPPSLKIWPNPTSGAVDLRLDSESTDVVPAILLDAFGRRIQQMSLLPGQTTSLNLKDLSRGMYFLMWRDDEGKRHTEKLIRK